MSDFSDLYGQENPDQTQQPTGKDLRAQLEATLSENKRLKEEAQARVKAESDKALSARITEKELDPDAVKALMPSNLTGDDAVKWVDTYAQYATPASPASEKPQETPQEQQEAPKPENLSEEEQLEIEAMLGSDTRGPSVPGDLSSKLDSVQTEEELWGLFGGDGSQAAI